MIRADEFRTGDSVTLIPVDEYGYGPVQWRFRSAHGDGPYIVEEVVPAFVLRDAKVGHKQLLTVAGDQLSGWWFQPVR